MKTIALALTALTLALPASATTLDGFTCRNVDGRLSICAGSAKAVDDMCASHGMGRGQPACMRGADPWAGKLIRHYTIWWNPRQPRCVLDHEMKHYRDALKGIVDARHHHFPTSLTIGCPAVKH